MIFQLINRNGEWYQYFINAFIVIIGRSLDILSTRYVTKELKLETNKLAQKIGWKGMILIQIPIIIIGALDFYFAFFIFIWSLFLFANNIEGSWYVKEVGEESYQKELKSRVDKSKTWKIIFSELSSILTFSIAGILILFFLFIIKDILIVILIAVSLICHGLLGTIRSIQYLIGLKKEKSENQDD
jgi:VIT1/CCC1 family predicted Fe2+/Mn2+ transporter